MKLCINEGISFGVTSGIITTLGLMVGLHAGTNSKVIVLGGILMIAIADALSDSLGMHISEESENLHTKKEIWMTTLSTFVSKFMFAMTFIVPVILLDLSTAIIVSVVWGVLLIAILSFFIARQQNTKAWKAIVEHVAIALAVIIITRNVGDWVAVAFQ